MDNPEWDERMPLLYDAENRWGPDDDFFLTLVNRRPGSRVLDLGCGTGRLTIALARAGHQVTGFDPNPAFLRAAQAKPGGDEVTWVQGVPSDLPTRAFDAAVMTSHVAQLFVSDDEWLCVLGNLKRALDVGGLLAFDSRDPRARGWKAWTRAATHGYVRLPDGTQAEGWVDVLSVDEGVVTFEWHNRFPDGSALTGASALRFRSEEELRDALEKAGFAVELLAGGWAHEPVGTGDGEIIVVART